MLPTDPRELVAATHFTRRVRGYDPEEVDAFLALLLDLVTGSAAEAPMPTADPSAAEPTVPPGPEPAHGLPPALPVAPPDPLAEVGDQVARVLAAADQQGKAMIAAAETEAERLVSEARRAAVEADLERAGVEAAAARGREELASVRELLEGTRDALGSLPPAVEPFASPRRILDHAPVVVELAPHDDPWTSRMAP